MLALLNNLQEEAVNILLFLKSVERIEVLRWDQGATEPQSLFSCAVKDPNSIVRSSRALFIQASQVCKGLFCVFSTKMSQRAGALYGACTSFDHSLLRYCRRVRSPGRASARSSSSPRMGSWVHHRGRKSSCLGRPWVQVTLPSEQQKPRRHSACPSSHLLVLQLPCLSRVCLPLSPSRSY